MGLIILEPVIGKEQWLIYIETAIYSGQILGLFTVLWRLQYSM